MKIYIRQNSKSGYFVIDSIFILEAILPSPFICVYIAIIATILAVTLCCMDGAACLEMQ